MLSECPPQWADERADASEPAACEPNSAHRRLAVGGSKALFEQHVGAAAAERVADAAGRADSNRQRDLVLRGSTERQHLCPQRDRCACGDVHVNLPQVSTDGNAKIDHSGNDRPVLKRCLTRIAEDARLAPTMAELDLLAPRAHDLGGGFAVRRLLPSVRRQAVGPFLFFDHFGPVTALPADNHDVRLHLHIGMATVTYLFEGAMLHRDSTGVVQRIEPGAINWMTAARGIVHSERTPDDLRGIVRRSHGVQLWSALPQEHEEDPPRFEHTPAAAIPSVELPGVTLRVLVGAAFGVESPVRTLSPAVYLDIALAAGATLTLPDVAAERALYSVDAAFEVNGDAVPAMSMLVLPPRSTPRVRALVGTRLVMLGGAPLGQRHMVWNFVSSRRERIVQARADWSAQRFDPVPGETEFIPLPSAST